MASESTSWDETLPMETATISIPSLREERQALDLSTALLSINGVGRIDADPQSHLLTVEYVAGSLTKDVLRETIRNVGYPVDDTRADT